MLTAKNPAKITTIRTVINGFIEIDNNWLNMNACKSTGVGSLIEFSSNKIFRGCTEVKFSVTESGVIQRADSGASHGLVRIWLKNSPTQYEPNPSEKSTYRALFVTSYFNGINAIMSIFVLNIHLCPINRTHESMGNAHAFGYD